MTYAELLFHSQANVNDRKRHVIYGLGLTTGLIASQLNTQKNSFST